MEHVTYGLFDDAEQARAAVNAIYASGTPREKVGVTVHRGRLDEGTAGIEATDAAEGRRAGAAVAGILGALSGALVMGPIGLVSGGALGLLYGGVAGALVGSGAPDRSLERLSQQLATGKVLVIVEASGLDARDAADAAMRANAGHVEHKPLF